MWTHKAFGPIGEVLTNAHCPLCQETKELIGHLFYECNFIKWVLAEAVDAVGNLVDINRITNSPPLAVVFS